MSLSSKKSSFRSFQKNSIFIFDIYISQRWILMTTCAAAHLTPHDYSAGRHPHRHLPAASVMWPNHSIPTFMLLCSYFIFIRMNKCYFTPCLRLIDNEYLFSQSLLSEKEQIICLNSLKLFSDKKRSIMLLYAEYYPLIPTKSHSISLLLL